jgi:hypothetical protein
MEARWGQYENTVHLMRHVGGVGCEIQDVCTIQELCVVIWEVYGIVWKPVAPDWSHVIQLGAMWCYMEAKCYMGAKLPHLGAMCDHAGAACTIWKPYRADGWDPGASVEVTRQGHIGLYSGTLRATFGSTMAKERRCGACRRLVLRSWSHGR